MYLPRMIQRTQLMIQNTGGHTQRWMYASSGPEADNEWGFYAEMLSPFALKCGLMTNYIQPFVHDEQSAICNEDLSSNF